MHALPRIAALLFASAALLLAPHQTPQTSVPVPAADSAATINTAPALSDHSVQTTIVYLREHGSLPSYYLTKSQAAKRGWVPSKGNLCTVAPDMMIGGDVFTNAQHLLPVAKGRKWHEADFDYVCGKTRNAKRILYSTDGLIYLTTDHYSTVTPAP